MAAIYPKKFEDVKLVGLPDEPNVVFEFEYNCPKKYTWDAWHLPASAGGDNTKITDGEGGTWPCAKNNMERQAGPVREIIGGIETPENGDWKFEWKAGAPYGGLPPPISALIFSAAHGKAQISDLPGDKSLVKIQSKVAPGMVCCCWMCGPMVQTVLKGLSAKAEPRFAAKEYLGPETMSR